MQSKAAALIFNNSQIYLRERSSIYGVPGHRQNYGTAEAELVSTKYTL
jgi:hypothetical protein